MTPGVLVIETTTGIHTYQAHNYIVVDGWLRVRRDRRTVVEFNAAYVVRIAWTRRAGEKR